VSVFTCGHEERLMLHPFQVGKELCGILPHIILQHLQQIKDKAWTCRNSYISYEML